MNCHYCGAERGLRPYGPGGAPICIDCVERDPQRMAEAEVVYNTLVDAAMAMSPVIIIGPNGPEPLISPDFVHKDADDPTV